MECNTLSKKSPGQLLLSVNAECHERWVEGGLVQYGRGVMRGMAIVDMIARLGEFQADCFDKHYHVMITAEEKNYVPRAQLHSTELKIVVWKEGRGQFQRQPQNIWPGE